jgi:hypothetical protein
MLAIEFWIVRKGDDPWKVAPEVGDAISGHSPRKCLFCGKRSSSASRFAPGAHRPQSFQNPLNRSGASCV